MAMVDQLAKILTRATGTNYTILRLRDRTYRGQQLMLYSLLARRKMSGLDVQSTFWPRGIPLHQMMTSLATICDMVQMGYVPVLPGSLVCQPGDIVTWGTGEYACRVVADDATVLVLESHTGAVETWSRPRRPPSLRVCPEGTVVGPILEE